MSLQPLGCSVSTPEITYEKHTQLHVHFRYKAIVQGKWYRHYCALQVSTLQIMGCIIYMYAEWHQGFRHLPAPVSYVADL